MNFYKRYIGDYMRDTAHLSLVEHGVYTVLLDSMYATGKGLPADVDALCRICRAANRSERAAVAAVADQFFPVNGDGSRHNKRADEEIAKHEAQAAVNRVIGRKGGRPKKTEQITDSVTDSQTQSVTDHITEQKPNRNPNHSQSKPLTTLAADAALTFQKFYAAYPKHQKRAKAEAEWRKLKPDEALLGIMLEAIRWQRQSPEWIRENGKYIPQPSAWLNGRRWEDEPATALKTGRLEI